MKLARGGGAREDEGGGDREEHIAPASRLWSLQPCDSAAGTVAQLDRFASVPLQATSLNNIGWSARAVGKLPFWSATPVV